MIKKVLLGLLLLTAPCLAQSTAGNSVIGFYLAPGQTSGSFTCKSNNIGPCFVPYGATIPTGGGSSSSPTFIKATPLTITPLDVATVTTGGTAVTALTAGHRTAGGFLLNPVGATINLCINEIGTASGTTSAGSLTCILPGQSYTLSPASTAVSVVTSDSAHPFSGYGLN